jgi:RES domain-containing protein
MAFRLRKPLHAYRIADSRRPIFDGSGAALHGGRWNSPGRPVIYCAETYAGALLEKLVHTNIGRIPRDQMYIEIVVPAEVTVEEVPPQELPGWDSEDQVVSRKHGDAWHDSGRTVVLVVPSVVVPLERNVLIHPQHPDARRIQVGKPQPVIWDERLFYRRAQRRAGV